MLRQWTDADARFAAKCMGVPMHDVREHLHAAAVGDPGTDEDGLGWIQLVAAAIPLLTSAFGKKKKPRGPSPEELEKQRQAELYRQQMLQRDQFMRQQLAQREMALRAAQQQAANAANQARAQVVAAARRPAPRQLAKASPMIPLAIAGAVGVALLLTIRR